MNTLVLLTKRGDNLDIEDFDYHLPKSFTAQTPLENRDQSRSLVPSKDTGELTHLHFRDIIYYFEPDDTLVLNDTRVMPARLLDLKEGTSTKVEMLVLAQIRGNSWEVLLKPAKRIKKDHRLNFGNGGIVAKYIEELEQGERIMHLHYEGVLQERLDKLGEMPLPPYIKEGLDDPGRYQAVYAKESGSAAAPTAGLCFTGDLLNKIRQKGVYIAFITLYIGLGTFRPVNVEGIDNHKIHSEYYRMTRETADLLNKTKEGGKRVVPVGTTSARTLETIRRDHPQSVATSEWIDISVYSGFEFKAIDGLITNFHLPKSTLVILVSAFSNKKYILNTYHKAVEMEYRFFGFGDAMLII